MTSLGHSSVIAVTDCEHALVVPLGDDCPVCGEVARTYVHAGDAYAEVVAGATDLLDALDRELGRGWRTTSLLNVASTAHIGAWLDAIKDRSGR